MDPDELKSKLHGLAAAARDYKKATLAPASALHHSPPIRFHPYLLPLYTALRSDCGIGWLRSQQCRLRGPPGSWEKFLLVVTYSYLPWE